MNKSYIQEGNNVTIYTDDGIKIKDYTDNISDILVQENVIEELENKTNLFNKKLKSLKLCKIVCKYVFPIVTTLISVVLFGFASGFDISRFLGLLVTILPAVWLGEAVMLYPEYKIINKKKNVVSKILDYLDQNLNSENEKLKQLKNNKTSTNVKEVTGVGVLTFDDVYDEELKSEKEITEELGIKKIYINDAEILNSLRKKIILAYIIKYNEELYYKYYDAGILNEKLQDEFTEEEIEQINTYFENAEVQTKNHKSAKRKHKVRA